MTSTTPVLPDYINDAAFVMGRGPGSTECQNFPVWVQGIRAVLLVRLDMGECDRRAATGLTDITSPGALRLLLTLPLDEPVPHAALTAAELSALRAIPQGVVSFDGPHVIRRAVPPLEVDLALVPAVSWRSGLERAGRFAPFCSRAMVLRQPPRDLDDLHMEAGFYSIGVIVASSHTEPEVLIEPAKFYRNRLTVAGWRFLEEVYRQISSSTELKVHAGWPVSGHPAAEGLPISSVPPVA